MGDYSSSPMALAKRIWFKNLIDSLLSSGNSKTDIATKLNFSPQRLTNIINGSDVLTDKVIDSFIAAYDLGEAHLVTDAAVNSLNNDNKEKEQIIDRLDHYLLLCGITGEQASINAGLDGNLLAKLRNEGKDITIEEADAYLKVFYDLNKEWLLNGKGEMRNGNALPFENKKEPMARILQLLNEEGVGLEEFARVVNSKVYLFNNAAKWPFDSRNLLLGNEKSIRGWVDAFCSVFPKYSKFWILTGKTSKYSFPPFNEE